MGLNSNTSNNYQNRENKVITFSADSLSFFGQILLFVLGCIGFLFCILSLIFIVKYRKHQLMKATSIFNSMLIVVGLLIGDCALILGSTRLTTYRCTAITFCHGICYGCIDTSFFTKTLRISRLYFGSLKGKRDFKCVDQNSIILQSAIILASEVCLSRVFLVVPIPTPSKNPLCPSRK